MLPPPPPFRREAEFMIFLISGSAWHTESGWEESEIKKGPYEKTECKAFSDKTSRQAGKYNRKYDPLTAARDCRGLEAHGIGEGDGYAGARGTGCQ